MVAKNRMHAHAIKTFLTLTAEIRNSLSLAVDATMSVEADACCDMVHSAVVSEQVAWLV
jgi:hypothetical protein